MDTRTAPIAQRLAAVRDVLEARNLAAVLVPSSDPHLSEYLPERWQGRRWLSGFTGSTATLVVGRDAAALFADSRYWEQADRELAGSGIALVRVASAAASHPIDWLLAHVQRGERVGVDADVLGLATAQLLTTRLAAAGVVLDATVDVFETVWLDRPALPAAAVRAHRPPHAVQPRAERLAAVRADMATHGATHHLISTLDDIAWLYNLRGADVPYNPVFLAHTLVGPDGATLYTGAGKIAPALVDELAADGVRTATYEAVASELGALEPDQVTLLVDPRRITLGLRNRVAAGVRVVEAINPSTLHKSRKSAAEAAHIRAAMVQDGAALCDFYADFEAALSDPVRRAGLTELSVDAGLAAARAARPGCVGPSFATIAGFAANGAMPHYRATPESHAALDRDGLLLIDSGAQYEGGTTDITRVWPIGQVGPEVRRDVTRVLKGTMALSRARFPRGTPAPMLDAIARAPLWEHGLDYGHGTGHGVGYFLNVHEGPQSISKVAPEPHMAMQPGMVTSIEPGLYRPGLWGVRIENLVLNVDCPTDEAGAFGDFLAFETLTLCPIDTRCLERALLRADEIEWLNAYHATVRERLAPHVAGAARDWLIARTEPF